MTHFLPKLRNPWRGSKEGQKFEEPKVQAIATDTSGLGSLDNMLSSLRSVRRAKYMTGALGLFKVSSHPLTFSVHPAHRNILQLCTLLPPMRSDLPPPYILYILILFIIVDLQAENVALSYVLNACHMVALLWMRAR